MDLSKAKTFQMYHKKTKILQNLDRLLRPLLPSHMTKEVSFSLRKDTLVVQVTSAILVLQVRRCEQLLLKACSSRIQPVAQLNILVYPQDLSDNPKQDHHNKQAACCGQTLDKTAREGLRRLQQSLKQKSLKQALQSMLSRYSQT